MFGLGFTEILMVAIIAFLVFGPQQFPIVTKNFIKLLNEIRSSFTEIKSEFYDIEQETQQHINKLKEDIKKDFELIQDKDVKNFSKNDKDQK